MRLREAGGPPCMGQSSGPQLALIAPLLAATHSPSVCAVSEWRHGPVDGRQQQPQNSRHHERLLGGHAGPRGSGIHQPERRRPPTGCRRPGPLRRQRRRVWRRRQVRWRVSKLCAALACLLVQACMCANSEAHDCVNPPLLVFPSSHCRRDDRLIFPGQSQQDANQRRSLVLPGQQSGAAPRPGGGLVGGPGGMPQPTQVCLEGSCCLGIAPGTWCLGNAGVLLLSLAACTSS